MLHNWACSFYPPEPPGLNTSRPRFCVRAESASMQIFMVHVRVERGRTEMPTGTSCPPKRNWTEQIKFSAISLNSPNAKGAAASGYFQLLPTGLDPHPCQI